MSGGDGELHQMCLRMGERNESHPNFGVGMGNPSKYEIFKPNMGNFLQQYCNLVHNEYEDLTLTEVTGTCAPVIFKLLLRFRNSNDLEIPTDEFLTRFVFLSQQVLVQNLQITDNSNELACFVLESDPIPSRDRQYTLISYRFQFPYIICEREFQKNTLRRHLIHRLEGSEIRPYITGSIGSWEDIIDKNIYEGPVPMYGSRTDPDEPHVEFRKVIKPLRKDEIDSTSHVEYDLGLWNSCNPREHSFVQRRIITDSDVFRNPVEVEFWLPVILSVHYCIQETMPRRRDKNSPANAYTPGTKTDIASFGHENDVIEYAKMDYIKIFADMWKTDRFLQLEFCNYLGEAIYDAMDGGEGGAFIWFTMIDKAIQETGTCPEFLKVGAREYCETTYYTFRLDRITYKTIAVFASKDNPVEYKKWHTTWKLKPLEIACNGWDYNLARALYRCYWLDFMCYYAGKKLVWLAFQRHRLCENPNGTKLRRLISEQFYHMFLNVIKEVSTQMAETDKKDLQTHGEEIIRSTTSTLRICRMDGSKNAIMRQAAEFFLHPEFDNIKDTNPELLGMPNGVLVATSEKVSVREGMIEDYITRTIPVPFRHDFSWDHPHVKEVTIWMQQMFPDPEMLHYFKKMLASILRGGNNDKKLFAFTGAKGNNAKTTWVRAVQAVLGGYCVKTPIALLTRGPGEANGPSPAVARLEGARLNVFEEAEHNIPLREGTMKHMTGNDNMYARGMRKNGKDIELMCKTWFVTNVMPAVQGGGGNALRNRFVNIPCDTIWSDKAPDNEAEQWAQRHFKADRYFENKLKYMAPALLWVMYQYYAIYVVEGLSVEPQVSLAATARYWEDNDQYYQFIAERVEKVYVDVTDIDGTVTRVLDDRVSVDVETLHAEFSNWYRVTFPANRRIPDRPTFRKEISARLEPPTAQGAWAHCQIKKHVVKPAQFLTPNMQANLVAHTSTAGMSNMASTSNAVNMAHNRSIMAY